MIEITSRTQALTQALILGLTAETEEKSDLAILLAALIARGMTEEQIQDIAMGVVAAAMESQNLMIPEMRQESEQTEEMMPEEPQMMPSQGMPQ